MSTAQKVAMVARVREEFGVAAALQAVGLARSTWHYQVHRVAYVAKHESLRRPLLAIAEKYPEYGYRRATTELAERLGRPVNRKVVQRLQRAWGLGFLRRSREPRPSGVRQLITAAGDRVNLVADLKSIGPFEVLYTDFTELIYGRGKACLMPVVDHHAKVCLGWAVGRAATTDVALQAWNAARAMLKRLEVPVRGQIVHHDQDTVFTSYRWVRQLLLKDEVRISYALRGAKDNPEMEAFNSRFKSENRSLFADAGSLEELVAVVRERMHHYNRRRRHSALGNQAPLDYVKSLSRKG
jgi:putative transposase